ncbi:MAG: acylphosphatase [Candidatus Hodarchaeales archaeon]|jgi:acylphosphatase
MKKRIHIKVTGRVQGVFYRISTREQAEKRGIKGCVMNMPDGSVFIDAEGSKEALKELIDWARRGPHHARVDSIDFLWEEELENYQNFTIKHSRWY